MIAKENEIMLSIVVTSHNQKETLKVCLDSIFAQQKKFSYEVVIAEDASTDGTLSMLKEQYGDRVRILEKEKNVGLCRNIYDAFSKADGKYIYYCQGDDYLPPEPTLNLMLEYLEAHEDIFSVTGWHEVYDVNKGTRTLIKMPFEEFSLLDLLKGTRVPFYTGMMRNTFKQDKPVYLYDAGRNCEEVQMWYYTLTKSKKIVLPQRVYIYCYRNNEESGSYNATHNHLQMLEDYAKGFRAVGKVDRHRHNFDIARMVHFSACIDYHIQNNGLKALFDIMRVLKFNEIMSFAWIKFLMKLNHRKLPEFLRKEKRLVRQK